MILYTYAEVIFKYVGLQLTLRVVKEKTDTHSYIYIHIPYTYNVLYNISAFQTLEFKYICTYKFTF